jgi:hypothetical protein
MELETLRGSASQHDATAGDWFVKSCCLVTMRAGWLKDRDGAEFKRVAPTTLYTLLAAHPQLILPQKKELQHPIRSAAKSLPITSFIPWWRSAFSVVAPRLA